MAAALLPATAADRLAFQERNDALMMERLRQGLYVGMLVGLVLCPPTRLAYPQLAWSYVLMPVFATLVMIVTSLLARVARFRNASSILSACASWTVGLQAAVVATQTGGFESPYFYVHILIYCFATAFFPASPRLLTIACFPNSVIACVVVAIWTPDPGRMLLPALFSGAAFVYSYIGAVVRAAGELESFVAHRRLAETKASLAALNDDLEARVTSQVAEIVRRASDIDALNAQLREKVQERSRELARALRTISEERPRPTLRQGDVLGGRAQIQRPIGAGGMGAVYLAHDAISGRAVAVKVLSAGGAATPTALRRFLAEAEAAAAVADPAIVKTLHVDVSQDGLPFQIMEFVDGVPLDRLIDSVGPVEPPLVAAIGAAIAGALAAAHAAGVVHRDVKPSNVMITHADPAIRVLDFGLSKLDRTDEPHSTALTATGTVVGTPAYMSPEQASGSADVGTASDVYSLGVLLYELAAGQHPFAGEGRIGLMLAHSTRAPAPLATVAAGMPPALASLVHAALAKDPAARPTAAALVDGLTPLAHGDPRSLIAVVTPGPAADGLEPSGDYSLGALATHA
ncbi:MAG: serine/threonine protein kinase [Myxococcales bacterium]|nr:serine/threonine protein kinase [Myxococcales bacterium]